MARFEILDGSAAPLGEGAAAGDMLFELGMMYSVGRDVPIDLISAHKWFNLAAVRGNLRSDPVAARNRRPDVGRRDCGGAARRARLAQGRSDGSAGSAGARDRGLKSSPLTGARSKRV